MPQTASVSWGLALLETRHLLDHLPWRPQASVRDLLLLSANATNSTAFDWNITSYDLWVLLVPFAYVSAIIAPEMEAS